MNIRNRFSNSSDTVQAEAPPLQQPRQIAGTLAVAGKITLVYQYANPRSGLYRYFMTHCIAGGKDMLPLGRGAAVPVLYFHEESETDEVAIRKNLISERDPYETTRKRARENIRHYCLRREDRIERSLLTRPGQHALWSALEGAQAVIIDCPEGSTKVARKDAASVSAAVTVAPLSELLERLVARGIAVVIFARAPGRNKMEPPAWLDGLPCNMVYVEEDHKNPMQGGARLTFYRDAINELDRTPRRFTWWWTVDEDGKLDFSCREDDFIESASPAQQAQNERREKIKELIAGGVTKQKELAGHFDVAASTINRGVLKKMIENGEILKAEKTGALSLPVSPDAALTSSAGDSPGNEAQLKLC